MNQMNALNFTLNHDDGLSPNNFHEADIVLVGVSRWQNTNLLIFSDALFFKAANYPLTSDDFVRDGIPEVLRIAAQNSRINNRARTTESYSKRKKTTRSILNDRNMQKRN